MIKAIIFDLWNTLFENVSYFNIRLNFFKGFLEDRNFSYSLDNLKKNLALIFNLTDVNLEKTDFHHIYIVDLIDKLLESLNIKLPGADKNLIKIKFEEAMLKNPPPLKKGVKETLKKLSTDYKIGLISNTGVTPGRVIKEVLQRYDILKYFQFTLFSDETGFYKPSELMFKTALKEFNCKPSNTIHVGDILETDIKGAKESNILTIWFNDSFIPKSNNIQPDYEIHLISDVIEIVENINKSVLI